VTETGADFDCQPRHLAPGELRLDVQGSNRNGQWSPQILSLLVTASGLVANLVALGAGPCWR
jgi:hypothetical protein